MLVCKSHAADCRCHALCLMPFLATCSSRVPPVEVLYSVGKERLVIVTGLHFAPMPLTFSRGKPPAAILQDIDVAYMADPQMFDDFEADLSSLLEVPDLDFPDSLDLPSGSFRDGSSQQWAVPTADPQALPGAAGSVGQLMSPHPVTTGSTKSSSKLPLSDQTVPDMPSLKRQRV